MSVHLRRRLLPGWFRIPIYFLTLPIVLLMGLLDYLWIEAEWKTWLWESEQARLQMRYAAATQSVHHMIADFQRTWSEARSEAQLRRQLERLFDSHLNNSVEDKTWTPSGPNRPCFKSAVERTQV